MTSPSDQDPVEVSEETPGSSRIRASAITQTTGPAGSNFQLSETSPITKGLQTPLCPVPPSTSHFCTSIFCPLLWLLNAAESLRVEFSPPEFHLPSHLPSTTGHPDLTVLSCLGRFCPVLHSDTSPRSTPVSPTPQKPRRRGSERRTSFRRISKRFLAAWASQEGGPKKEEGEELTEVAHDVIWDSTFNEPCFIPGCTNHEQHVDVDGVRGSRRVWGGSRASTQGVGLETKDASVRSRPDNPKATLGRFLLPTTGRTDAKHCRQTKSLPTVATPAWSFAALASGLQLLGHPQKAPRGMGTARLPVRIHVFSGGSHQKRHVRTFS